MKGRCAPIYNAAYVSSGLKQALSNHGQRPITVEIFRGALIISGSPMRLLKTQERLIANVFGKPPYRFFVGVF